MSHRINDNNQYNYRVCAASVGFTYNTQNDHDYSRHVSLGAFDKVEIIRRSHGHFRAIQSELNKQVSSSSVRNGKFQNCVCLG